MNVYIVAVGERGEGASPEAVFAELEDAMEYANGAHGVYPHQTEHKGRWVASSGEVDQVWILRMAVR